MQPSKPVIASGSSDHQTACEQTTSDSSTTEHQETIGKFSVLRDPNYAWFLSGTTLINAANWIQNVTLSWLVYDITSSGAMLGTLNLVRSIATVGLAPIAGVLIDRTSYKRLLYAVAIWLMVISFGMAYVIYVRPSVVWTLFVFSLLGGIGLAVSMPLRQTVIFAIVPRQDTPSAVALMQTGWAVMRSIGPAIGGFLILWFGPSGNFLVQGLCYALVALTVMKLSLPKEQGDVAARRRSGSMREGFTYIAHHPTTRVFILMSWVLPLFIIPNFNALPPIYAKDIYGGGPDTLGILLSAIGVGGIVGGFVTTSLGDQERRGLVQLASLLMLSLSLIGFALTTNFWLACLLLAFSGFFEMIYLTTNMTLIQLSIPDEVRGRVTGIVTLRSGLMPIGAFVAGIGSDFFGPQIMTIVLSGIAGVVAILVFFLSPIVRNYRMSEGMAEAELSAR